DVGIRPDETGYGTATKALHWVTVLAMAAQFLVGYAIDRADDLLDPVADRFFAGEPEGLVVVHAALGTGSCSRPSSGSCGGGPQACPRGLLVSLDGNVPWPTPSKWACIGC